MNTFGRHLRLTTFGESHGPAMGGVLDGMPPRIRVDMDMVEAMLRRRRTGTSHLVSQRRESDIPEILSGVSPDGLTLGTPIGFIFRNTDARSSDYDALKDHYRPNHADMAYDLRYGIRDHRGGGRASARETVSWVMGGALAMLVLREYGITVRAKVTRIGPAEYSDPLAAAITDPAHAALPDDPEVEKSMLAEVEKARADRDSVGGRVSCLVTGVPAGLGSPVFGKLQSRLAQAMMGINAAKGFEYGIGEAASRSRGSETLDPFNPGFFPLPTATGFSGGISGGITTGMPVCFNVWFKPTPSIPRELEMATPGGEIERVTLGGRHDPCVALRAPVIVEAMTALTLADVLLESGMTLDRALKR
ncbi:MAG: chorismate synthase [Bacteroides sp.]|nr:chorismate synthase [Bacteroides sp.]